MTSGWRLPAVLGEAVANALSSTGRTVVLAAGIGGVLGALVWAELMSSLEVKNYAERFSAAGGHVVVAEGPQGLNAARCDALRWHPLVLAAGGYRGGGGSYASNAPGVSFERFQVTAGLPAVWDPGADPGAPGALWVGAAAAAELGLRNGSWVSLDDQPAARVAVLDPAQRNPFAARAFMEPIPPVGRLDQCWVEFPTASAEAGLDWLASYFAEDEAETRRAIDRGQFSVDPTELLAARPQRWAWLPVGAVGSAMIALMALFRRSEAALYRAFGLDRVGYLIMQQAETLLLVVTTAVVAYLWAVVIYAVSVSTPELDQLFFAFRNPAQAAVVVIVLGPLLAVLVTAGTPASLLKES